MRTFLCWILAAVAAATASSCASSQPIEPKDFAEYWSLDADPSDSSQPYRPQLGQTKLPWKWTIHGQCDVIQSTVSLVRAREAFQAEAGEIEFSVSLRHAQAMLEALSQIRGALAGLGNLTAWRGAGDRRRWAAAVAAALVQVDRGARAFSGDSQAGAGMPVEPLFQMLSPYLNEQSRGSLLGDLSGPEVRRLRAILTQMVLHVGLSAAGKRQPPGLRQALTARLEQIHDPGELKRSLEEVLDEQAAGAEAAPSPTAYQSAVRVAAKWVPRAIETLESFARQWENIDRVVIELRRRGEQTILVVTIQAAHGREVRIPGTFALQPTLIFRGASRIVICRRSPETDETVVLFEPIGDGSVDVRFEGLGYALARSSLPLANGSLREVRVLRVNPGAGTQALNVAVFMEAREDPSDPRRLLVFQDTRRKRLQRDAFSVRSVVESERQVFHYLTPQRVYTVSRETSGEKH